MSSFGGYPTTKLAWMRGIRMQTKQRLSASGDPAPVAAGRAAAAAGRAQSLSAWVNDARRRKADDGRRMRARDEPVHAREAEHGEVTADEMRAAARRARARATVGRGPPAGDDRPARHGWGAARA